MFHTLGQFLVVVSSLALIDAAYYLPGVTPHAYQQYEPVSRIACLVRLPPGFSLIVLLAIFKFIIRSSYL